MAGGCNGSVLDSVEILDTLSGSWRVGPKLPNTTYAGVMIEDSDGGVLYLGGDTKTSTGFPMPSLNGLQ